jgi:hypothetical protein
MSVQLSANGFSLLYDENDFLLLKAVAKSKEYAVDRMQQPEP